MSGVGVEFIGGPEDGLQLWINCEDPMDPPRFIEFAAMPWKVANSVREPLPAVVQVRYVREPSTRDEGPLWMYRWAGELR